MGIDNTIKLHLCEICVLAGAIISGGCILYDATFQLGQQHFTFSGGLYTYQCILIILEGFATCTATDALAVRISKRQHEIVIAHATPSPVHVEETFAIIAINNKLVASDICLTRIKNRTPGSQFSIDDILPLTCGKDITVDDAYILAITKNID